MRRLLVEDSGIYVCITNNTVGSQRIEVGHSFVRSCRVESESAERAADFPSLSHPVAGEPGGAKPPRDAGGPGRADGGPEPAGGVQVRRPGAPGQGHQLVQGRPPAAPGQQVRQGDSPARRQTGSLARPLLTLAVHLLVPRRSPGPKIVFPSPALTSFGAAERRPSNSKSAAAKVIPSNFYSRHVIRFQTPSRRSPS